MNKIKCEGCGHFRMVRQVVQFKGQLLCYFCRMELLTSRIQSSATETFCGMKRYSLEKALSKIYEARGYVDKNNHLKCVLGLPSILIGHKFKIVLVD